MIAAPFPTDETARVALLDHSGLLDGPPDPFLDAAVVMVAATFRVPICLLSIVERDRQVFEARTGVAMTQTNRDCSFCARVLWDTDPLVVTDDRCDPRFADNPLVTGPRAYASTPA